MFNFFNLFKYIIGLSVCVLASQNLILLSPSRKKGAGREMPETAAIVPPENRIPLGLRCRFMTVLVIYNAEYLQTGQISKSLA